MKPPALAELVTGRLIEASMNAKNFRGFYAYNNFYIFNRGRDRDNTAFFIKHSERAQVPLDEMCLRFALTKISPP